jgi:hypothetical protein
MFDGQLVRDSFERKVPCRFFRQRSSQGRCPWLWCVWPLANRTGRDVRWRKCDTRFFSPKAIFIIAWGNAPGRVMVCLAVGQSNRSRCSMAQCDTRFFSPKAILIIAWGNAPGRVMVCLAVGQSGYS